MSRTRAPDRYAGARGDLNVVGRITEHDRLVPPHVGLPEPGDDDVRVGLGAARVVGGGLVVHDALHARDAHEMLVLAGPGPSRDDDREPLALIALEQCARFGQRAVDVV